VPVFYRASSGKHFAQKLGGLLDTLPGIERVSGRIGGDELSDVELSFAEHVVGLKDQLFLLKQSLDTSVTDDLQRAREQAAETYQRYGEFVNYRRMLDLEGVDGPSEVTLIGDEAEIVEQLRAYAASGATDFLASIFPVGEDEDASVTRSMALVKSLVGKVGV